MNRQKEKSWILIFLSVFAAGIVLTACAVVEIDPFFHYHAPLTDRYYYRLNSERNQNDGITRHFDYTGLITGTSHAENFKTSEAEALFGGRFIKIPYAGASYREIQESVARALKRNPKTAVVIRALDIEYLLDGKDNMREDMGVFPSYLYDDDLLNDIRYVLNRNVVFSRACRMLSEKGRKDFMPGMTDFDDYAVWHGMFPYGAEEVCPYGIENPDTVEQKQMSDKTRARLLEGIRQNITDLAKDYPEVEFIYFLTPYSLAWWRDMVAAGTSRKWLEAERILAEEALLHPNIRLFSWNDRTDIIGDLDNYIDKTHYGPWISEQLLQYMQEGQGLLTNENCGDFFDREMNLHLTFDYESMMR